MNSESQSKKKALTPEQVLECETLNSIFIAKKNELGLSQAKIATAAGITPPAISHYLKAKNPLNVPIAVVFSELLQVPISAFSRRLAEEAAKISKATLTQDGKLARIMDAARKIGAETDQDVCNILKVPMAQLKHWKANGLSIVEAIDCSVALKVDVETILPADVGPDPESPEYIDWLREGDGNEESRLLQEPDHPFTTACYLYPVLSEEDAINPFQSINAMENRYRVSIASPKWAGPFGYWLKVSGDSMARMDGLGLQDGVFALVNPSASPRPGSFGVFSKPENTPPVCVRMLIEDSGLQYLKPLNREYRMSDLKDGWTAIGALVSASYPDSFFN